MNQITTQKTAVSQQVPVIAERLIDRVFEQLIASCPILLTVQTEQLKILKQQWILGFAENGITQFEQVKRGMAAMRTKPNGYLPSVGEFIQACSGEDFQSLGLPVLEELLLRLKKFMSYGMEYIDQFRFMSDAEYWLITDLYHRNKSGSWYEDRLEREAKIALKAMAEKVKKGDVIPKPTKQISATTEVMPSSEVIEQRFKALKQQLGMAR